MMKKPRRLKPEFEVRPESPFQTNIFLDGLPVYRDRGIPLGPDDKNKWERCWEDGFFTAAALYRMRGLKPQPKAQFKAFIASTRGRLIGLYHRDDGIPVKRHAESQQPRLPRVASSRKSPVSRVSEALLAKIREVGEYLDQQDRIFQNRKDQT